MPLLESFSLWLKCALTVSAALGMSTIYHKSQMHQEVSLIRQFEELASMAAKAPDWSTWLSLKVQQRYIQCILIVKEVRGVIERWYHEYFWHIISLYFAIWIGLIGKKVFLCRNVAEPSSTSEVPQNPVNPNQLERLDQRERTQLPDPVALLEPVAYQNVQQSVVSQHIFQAATIAPNNTDSMDHSDVIDEQPHADVASDIEGLQLHRNEECEALGGKQSVNAKPFERASPHPTRLCDAETFLSSRKNPYVHVPPGVTDWQSTQEICTLVNKSSNEQLPVVGISWNCLGTSIAASFGQAKHDTQCSHRSALCFWELDELHYTHNEPKLTIAPSFCVTSICFHPTEPSLLAGGNCEGELYLWNVGLQHTTMITTDSEAHKRHVSSLTWITNRSSKERDYRLVSASFDGRLLIWQLDKDQQALHLLDDLLLQTESLPSRHLQQKSVPNEAITICDISFNHKDGRTLVVGAEDGGLSLCSSQIRSRAVCAESCVKSRNTTAVKTEFVKHKGPITGVEFSKFDHDLFLSSSLDGTVHLNSVRQHHPLLVLKPTNASEVLAVKWSPHRPPVLCMATSCGDLCFYDFHIHTRSHPFLNLSVGSNKTAISCLEFSPSKKKLLATGDENGRVTLLNLRHQLTEKTGDDDSVLTNLRMAYR